MVLPFKGVFYELNSLITAQGTMHDGRKFPCSDFELNAAECIEAYGLIRGQEKCVKFVEDLQECRQSWKTLMRWYIMRQTRYEKIAKGEIPVTNRWGASYPYDSYIGGTFNP